MSKTAVQDFLAQFSASKESVTKWPSWMQESARMATASFPKPLHSEAKTSRSKVHTSKQKAQQ